MNKIDNRQLIAYSYGYFLIETKKPKYTKPNPYVVAVCYELASNFRVIIESDLISSISEEEAINYYLTTIDSLFRSKSNLYNGRRLQPDFPDLIKIKIPETYSDLRKEIARRIKEDIDGYPCDQIKRKLTIVTYTEFRDSILKKPNLDKYDFMYLDGFDDYPILEKLLYSIYSNYSYFPKIYPTENLNFDTINLDLKRKDRELVLEKLNNPAYQSCNVKKSHVQYWNKLNRVLHPGERKYKTKYPFAFAFLYDIMDNSMKKMESENPNHTKLHNIMTAAWKKGEEFEALNSWISRKDISPGEILSEIRHYEVSPRIDPFRNFNLRKKKWGESKEVVIGSKIPTDFDIEIATEIKQCLKQKFLDSISEIPGKTFRIPDSYKKIPATYIQKEILLLSKKLESDRIKVTLVCDKYRCSLPVMLVGEDKQTRSIEEIDLVDHNSFSEDYSETLLLRIGGNKLLNKGYNLAIVMCEFYIPYSNTNHLTLTIEDPDTNEVILVNNYVKNSSIVFCIDLTTNTLFWINESTKKFFNGNLYRMNCDFNYLAKLLCYPRVGESDFLSLYDVCEKLYGRSKDDMPEITEKEILEDIKKQL